MKHILFLFTVIAVLSACKETSTPNDKLIIYADGIFRTGAVPDTVDGRVAKISSFRIYLSRIRLVTEDLDTIPVANYFLYDYPANAKSVKIAELEQPARRISKLLFSVGLYPQLNATDPVIYPAGHPLSIDKDMYWGMLKYRFLVAEGAFDSSAAKSGAPNFPFSLHLGTDTLYRELAIPVYGIGGVVSELYIELSPLTVYHGYGEFPLDMRDYYSNHSSPAEIPDAIELMDNFVSRITTKEVIKYLPD